MVDLESGRTQALQDPRPTGLAGMVFQSENEGLEFLKKGITGMGQYNLNGIFKPRQ